MSNQEIASEVPISMSEMKSELEKIKKRDKELSFRAEKTLEYINQLVPKSTSELSKKLAALEIPRIREHHIAKITDLLPTSIRDLKVILQAYTVTVNNENMKKVVDAVNEFLAK